MDTKVRTLVSSGQSSPARILAELARAFDDAYRIAEKEVGKRAIERLPLDVRATGRGSDVIAYNIGQYLLNPKTKAWQTIYCAVERLDSQYRAAQGLPQRHPDETWNEIYPFLCIAMGGLIRKKQLEPHLDDNDWLFDLVS